MSVIGLKIFVIYVRNIFFIVATMRNATYVLRYLHIEILLFRPVLDCVEVRYFRGQESGLPRKKCTIQHLIFNMWNITLQKSGNMYDQVLRPVSDVPWEVHYDDPEPKFLPGNKPVHPFLV